jgi:hypothetical protein
LLGVLLLRRVLAELQRGHGFEPAQVPLAFRLPVATGSDAKS